MDYGSSHVWMYDSSDEEFLSETELQEGMWLSDSDEDAPEPLSMGKLTLGATVVPKPQQQSQPQEAAGQPLVPQASKYQSLSRDSDTDDDDDDDDDEEEEEEEEQGPSDGDKKLNYIEVEAVGGAPPPPRPPLPASGTGRDVEYVQLKPSVAARRGHRQRRKPASSAPVPSIRVPSPPPPPPPRGIIKNRLVPKLKKLRQARVRWERSDSNEGRQGRRTRRADTNVLAVKFNTLTGPSHVHTGDAVVCGNPDCTAIFSHLSSVKDRQDPASVEKIWVCEFCGTENEVEMVPEEMPTKDDTTYMIAPAPVVGGGAAGGASVEDSLVIFCIDVSGSMCVTTEVHGKFELKGVRDFTSLNVGDRRDQYIPGQRRDVTYVSRLQSVQAAVDHQLKALSSTQPSQRIALLTFSDEVTVLGDGKSEVVTVAGDKLWSSDAVVKAGAEAPLPAAVKDTRAALSTKVFELEEGGQTALGPALLLSISMASRVPGSKVIICTDGLANKGVGNLDDVTTDESQAAVQTFYEDLGALALEKGVTVSLVTIKGTDCRTLELGQVADRTGGQVTIVDPLTITKEFGSILANPIIATNVMTKIILHRDLYFRTEESQESVLSIPVGNVTADTELTYEYGARHKKRPSPPPDTTAGTTAEQQGAGVKSDAGQETTTSPGEATGGASDGATGGATVGAIAAPASPKQKKVAPLTIDGTPHLPFQLQIEYTGLDGSQQTRVITQAKPITKDRKLAERAIDMAVVGTHVAHQTAKLAMEGEYTQARVSALANQRLMQRNSHVTSGSRVQYANLMEDLIPLENVLRDKQQRERTVMGRNYSDDEDEEQYFYDRPSELMATELASERKSKSEPVRKMMRAAPKKKKAISRRKDIDDDVATYCYQMKSSKSTDYTET